MIYLGCPYQHDNIAVMEQRFEAVSEYAAKLMKEGHIVFSPISQNHPIAQYGLPRGWDFWKKFDSYFLERSTSLYVYKLPGWENSVGLTDEIKMAKELGLEIVYVEYEEKGRLLC